MGRMIVFEYYPYEKGDSKSGRLKSITDFSGRVISYEYDENGDLVKASFEGRSRTYTYKNDPSNIKLSHNLESVTDCNGQKVLELSYDSEDKLTSQRIGGISISVSSGETATTTDGNGNIRTYSHNESGHPISIIEGGFETKYTYNSDGLLTSITYPLGNKVEYTYDSTNPERRSQSNLLSVKETPGPKGAKEPSREIKISYDGYFNQILSLSLPDGLSFQNQIDENGNIISSTSNIPGFNFNYTYNQYGQLLSEEDPLGGKTIYSYLSGNGYLESISTSLYSANFGYDERGNLTEYSDSEGTSAKFSLSMRNEILSTKVKTPGTEYIANYEYDGNGNLLTLNESYTGEQISRSYKFSYNLHGNIISLQDSLKGTYQFEYDGNQNLKTLTEPEDRQIIYGYDGRNLLTSITRKKGNLQFSYGFEYDGNRNPVAFTNPKGAKTQFLYDGYDRFSGIIDPLGNRREEIKEGGILTILEKDKFGNILRKSTIIKDPLGRITERRLILKTPQGEKEITFKYSYDLKNRKIIAEDPEGRKKSYLYDSGGRIIKEENPDGSSIEYFYDGIGNLTKILENEKAPDGSIRSYQTQYIYEGKRLKKIIDPAGNQTQLFYDGRGNLSGVIDAEGGKVSYEYDGLGRKVKEERYLEDGRVERIEMGYDISGNLISIKDGNGNETRYEYDGLGRLIKTIYPDGRFYEISYDEMSNPVQIKDPNGTIVKNHYDLLNRLIRREIQRGEGVEGATFEEYEYDSLGRVVRAKDDDSEVLLSYDELGRIISEIQNGKLIQYSYDGVGNLLKVRYPNQRIVEREFDVLNRLTSIKENGSSLITFAYQGLAQTGRNYRNGISMFSQLDIGRRVENMVYSKEGNLVMGYGYEWNRVGMRIIEERIHRGKLDRFSYDWKMRLINAKLGIEKNNPDLFEKQISYVLDLVDNIRRITETKDSTTTTIETTINNRNQYTKFGNLNLSYDSNGNLKQKGEILIRKR